MSSFNLSHAAPSPSLEAIPQSMYGTVGVSCRCCVDETLFSAGVGGRVPGREQRCGGVYTARS